MVYKIQQHLLARCWAQRDSSNKLPPTGRLAFTSTWLWLLILFTIVSFFESAFLGQLLTFTPLYLPLVGVTPNAVPGWLGGIALVGGLVGVPFVPFWGALADRHGQKPLIVRAFVALLIGAALTYLAPSPWFVMFGRAATSFALGSSGLMMTELAERTPAGRLGIAFAVMNGSGPIGTFLGPILGGPVIDRWGMLILLLINMAILLACIAALLLGYQGKVPPPVTDSLWGMADASLRHIVQSPRLRVLFPAFFLLFSGWTLATTYIPLIVPTLYQGEQLGLIVGLVMGGGGLLALLLAPVLGVLGDRYGCWRVLISAATVTIFLWPLPALMPTLVSFGVAWAILNGLTSGIFALSFTVFSDAIVPAMRSRIMCFAYVPLLFAEILGPTLGALITKQSLFAIFPAAAGLTALGVGAVAWAFLDDLWAFSAPFLGGVWTFTGYPRNKQ